MQKDNPFISARSRKDRLFFYIIIQIDKRFKATMTGKVKTELDKNPNSDYYIIRIRI